MCVVMRVVGKHKRIDYSMEGSVSALAHKCAEPINTLNCERDRSSMIKIGHDSELTAFACV